RLQLFHEHFTDDEELAAALRDFEIIVLMRERTAFTRKLVERLPNLKLLVTTGSRNGAIDLNACKAHGILVCGTRNSEFAAAELTWGLILAQSRHLLEETTNLRRSEKWQTSIGLELSGRT